MQELMTLGFFLAVGQITLSLLAMPYLKNRQRVSFVMG